MADSIAPIGIKIVADVGDVAPKMKTASDAVASFSTTAGSALNGMAGHLAAATTSLGNFATSFGSSGFAGAFGQAAGQLEAFSSKLLGATGMFGGFAAAGVGAFAAIGAAALSTARNIENINRLGRSLGTNAHDTQVLTRVFESGGLSSDDARSTVLKFGAQLGRASYDDKSEQFKAFTRIGLDPGILNSRGTVNALEQTFESLRRIQNVNERNDASRAIFSKSFTELGDITSRGSGAFRQAELDVDINGVSKANTDRAESTHTLNKLGNAQRNARGGGILTRWKQFWDNMSTEIDEATSLGALIGDNQLPFMSGRIADVTGWSTLFPTQGARSSSRNTGLPGSRRRPIALDTYIDDSPSKAQIDADNLQNQWGRDAALFATNSRATARLHGDSDFVNDAQVKRLAMIEEARASDVSEATIRELTARNAVITALERRADLESNVNAMVDHNRTALENFFNTNARLGREDRDIRATGDPALIGRLGTIGRSRVSSFLALEHSLGSLPSSFAISGLDPRTIDGARAAADLQVRGEIDNQDPRSRVASVMERIRDIEERTNREHGQLLSSILDAIRNAPVADEGTGF